MIPDFDVPMRKRAIMLKLALALLPVFANHCFVIINNHRIEIELIVVIKRGLDQSGSGEQGSVDGKRVVHFTQLAASVREVALVSQRTGLVVFKEAAHDGLVLLVLHWFIGSVRLGDKVDWRRKG